MVDRRVGPADVGTDGPQSGEDLLVDAERPAHPGIAAEQSDVVDGGGRAAGAVRDANALHDVGRVLVLQPGEERRQFRAVGAVDPVVRVHPKDPSEGGVAEGLVAGRGEIVDPGELEHVGPEAAGDLPGTVGRTGVDDDDLADDVADRFQTGPDVRLLVPDDHAERDPVPRSRDDGGTAGPAKPQRRPRAEDLDPIFDGRGAAGPRPAERGAAGRFPAPAPFLGIARNFAQDRHQGLRIGFEPPRPAGRGPVADAVFGEVRDPRRDPPACCRRHEVFGRPAGRDHHRQAARHRFEHR